ncbi:MAG: hypothetical protein V5A55_06365 [Halovenus sp.]
MADDTATVHIETDDGEDELTVPLAVIDMLTEPGEGASEVVADLAMLGLAQQAHGMVHHSQEDIGEELEAAEELTMDLFEERFGKTYGEMTGHSH